MSLERKLPDNLFAQALSATTKEKGLSQEVLARNLGVYPSTVSHWYRSKTIPSPENFGNLLILLKPGDQKIDALVDSYADQLKLNKGVPDDPVEAVEIRFKKSRTSLRLETDSPIGKWLEGFVTTHHLSYRHFTSLIGLGDYWVLQSMRKGYSVALLALLLEKTDNTFNFGEQEREELAEAVCQTFIKQVSENRQMHSYNPRAGLYVQQKLSCRTYTGGQAAKELGISREAIRQQRGKLGIDYTLLTENDLYRIKENLNEHRMKNHPNGNGNGSKK